MTTAVEPMWVAQLELAVPSSLEPVSDQDQRSYRRARVLIRLHCEPVGFVDVPVPRDGLTAEEVGTVARRELADRLRAHGEEDREEEIGWRHPFDVVVCTRDRPEQLRDCLCSLRRLRYARFRVVLVDNAPADERTHQTFVGTVGEDERFHYTVEPRPGLSRARNRGLAEATSPYVAFTDDDAVVDPWWLHGFARGFARRADVACVTGIVPSAALDTAAQRYFDRRSSWSAVLQRQLYSLRHPPADAPLFPFNAGSFGTGANLAVDRQAVRRIGGFDEALGAGSRTHGGEDLDLFVRILRAGYALAHEPSAIVWHRHRASAGALRQQMSHYGVALGAYLTKQLADRAARADLLRRAPRGVLHMLSLWHNAGGGGQRRDLRLVLAEVSGLVRGPWAYRSACRALAR